MKDYSGSQPEVYGWYLGYGHGGVTALNGVAFFIEAVKIQHVITKIQSVAIVVSRLKRKKPRLCSRRGF